MKTLISVPVLILTLVGAIPTVTGAGAAQDRTLDRRYSPAVEQFTYSFATMPLLARRNQNHCGYYFGHFICADHCGIDYQVFYCSKASAGCCHIGRGYCDDAGHLRCSPTLF